MSSKESEDRAVSPSAPSTIRQKIQKLLISVGVGKEDKSSTADQEPVIILADTDRIIGASSTPGPIPSMPDSQFLLSFKPDPTTGEVKAPMWQDRHWVDAQLIEDWYELAEEVMRALDAQSAPDPSDPVVVAAAGFNKYMTVRTPAEKAEAAVFLTAFDISYPHAYAMVIKPKTGITPIKPNFIYVHPPKPVERNDETVEEPHPSYTARVARPPRTMANGGQIVCAVCGNDRDFLYGEGSQMVDYYGDQNFHGKYQMACSVVDARPRSSFAWRPDQKVSIL